MTSGGGVLRAIKMLDREIERKSLGRQTDGLVQVKSAFRTDFCLAHN